MLGVLLKRQFLEKTSVFRRGARNVDYLGAFITLALAALVVYVAVTVFSGFTEKFCAIRINGVSDVKARQFELMTLIYGAIFVFGVFGSISEINRSVFESDDRNVLMTMPVSLSTVFYSKLIFIYLKQTAVYLAVLLIFNLTFAAATEQSAYYIVTSLLLCFVFPVLSLAAASVFCLPVWLLKRALQTKYTFILVTVTVLLGVFFWGYSVILDFFKALMTTGEIKFFFSERVMNIIIAATADMYPVNLMANIVLGREIGKNIGILAAFLIGLGAAGFVIVRLLFNYAAKTRSSVRSARIIVGRGNIVRARHPFFALLGKEFDTVFRTPSYAVQYISVAAVMPLMVFFCMRIGSDLLNTLVLAEKNFELAVFLVILFGALTNTFCATNISRDGNAFYALKTMPVSCGAIIGAKIFFCSVVFVLSAGLSVTLLSSLGFISYAEGAFVFFAAAMLGEAQICFATRKDLNRPRFPYEEDNEVKETNSSVSSIIFIGIISAVALGGVPLIVSVFSAVKGGGAQESFTYLFVGAASTALLAAALIYTLTGLKKKFNELTEGSV